ncbi:MAG: Gfo/Idh/MocA family oxidoreductase [Candidatus Eisenbacteria bacterium]
MSEVIPVAVIGCGHLGTFHARLYGELPEAKLEAVVDLLPDRARTLGESVGAAAVTDLADVLPQVRAVSIATPTSTHHEVARRCLEAGVSCLVEKPICETTSEGEDLIRLARERGLVLAVGHTERFNPAFAAVRSAVTAPRFVESHRLAPFVARSLDVDVVLDLMIHDLDLTLSLVAAPVESVDAVGVPVLTPGADIANARIRFADGAVANLTASRVSRDRVRKIRFFGPRQYHSLDLATGSVERAVLRALPAGDDPSASGTVSGFGAGGALPPGDAALAAYLAARHLELDYGEVPVVSGNALLEELRDFLGTVGGGGPLTGADGAAGLRSLELAQRIRREVARSLERLGVSSPTASA